MATEARSKYFTQLRTPKIYAYTENQFRDKKWEGPRSGSGLLKVGFTVRNVGDRMREHFPTASPNKQPYEVVLETDAITDSGEFFMDYAIHRILENKGVYRIPKTEWFECTIEDVQNAVLEKKTGNKISSGVVNSFFMRPEQKRAVKITADYFRTQFVSEEKAPHFLWNAKMRFGKTFTTFQLAKEMGWTRIMVLTYKPAVEREWRTELTSHIDFQNWQFLGRGDDYSSVDLDKPLCWFASFQDILGKTTDGEVKQRFNAAHEMDWDCIVLDEYHFGAWREAAKELYDSDKSEPDVKVEFVEEQFPLHSKSFLYLTGTPFRALADGEFLEDQIFTWSYIDEQREKENWNSSEPNPYLELPQMVLMTYLLPEDIREVALRGELNEFDLNEFFKAEEMQNDGSGAKKYQFIHVNEVQQWISLIRGQYLQSGFRPDAGVVRPPLPFGDRELLAYLNHTIWFLPSVASCFAMAQLLREPQNSFFGSYKVITAAGTGAGIGMDALPPVTDAIGSGLETQSITLTCGKLTTGVTVPQWCGIFMLRNTSSPETYFQTAFRVQSPWKLNNIDVGNPNKVEVLKEKCYIFDFAPNRALSLISEYSSRLDLRDSSPAEEKVKNFLHFLPVLSYDGFQMTPLDSRELLNMAASGVGATMLARRWQSDLLVRVDRDTLGRLFNNPELMAALMQIEGFRNINKEISKIINSESALDKLKAEKQPLTKNDIAVEREVKKDKETIKKKLKQFVTRVPIFMYLTDYREESLKDVITQLERGLFTKVTGLEIHDFEKLCEIGVFNSQAMNSAIFSFKRFEEGSLHYAGGGEVLEKIGLFDTVISALDEF